MINKIENFFYKEQNENVSFLSFFRISIALFCALHFLSVWHDFGVLYGKDGLLPAEVASLMKVSWIPSFSQVSQWLSWSIGMEERGAITGFQIVYLLLCLALACGLFSRISAISLLFLHLVLAKGSYLYAYGVDYFTTIALFYCCVFPVGRQLSVDRLIFPKMTVPNPTPYRRILQTHLCFVYFFSGLDKLMGYNWHNGESVWKALHLPYFNTDFDFNIDALSAYPLLFFFMGWAVILVELLYPFFVFHGKTRPYWLFMVVALHLGILLYLNLYFFAVLMILLNLAAFVNLKAKEEPRQDYDLKPLGLPGQ